MTKLSVDEEEIGMNFSMEKMNEDNRNNKYMFRICLIGGQSVGKTSLLLRYTDDNFKDKYYPTIGMDFRVITLKYKDIIAKVHIWDTAGQEKFKSIALNYYRSSNGFIYVYDVTDKDSLKNLEFWIGLTKENASSNFINFLVGNKNDLEKKREVSKEEGEEFAKKHNLIFMETSAKNNSNVQKLFEYFTYKLIMYFEANITQYIGVDDDDTNNFKDINGIHSGNKEKKKCGC